MTVEELIARLEKCPADMEVVFDITPAGSEMFHFITVDLVERIETSEEENYILLSSGYPGRVPPNLN